MSAFVWGHEFTVIVHDFKHNLTNQLTLLSASHSTPDRRRILTMEIAITAFAAVRSITITACLIMVEYIRIEFE
jgi:hypothetical protein